MLFSSKFCKYPVNSVFPCFSKNSSINSSFIISEIVVLLSFERCTCSASFFSNSSSDASNPWFSKINFVSSNGNPKVSYSLKVNSAGNSLWFAPFNFWISSSNISVPFFKVVANLSSSSLITFSIYSCFSANSGYASFIVSRT